MSAPKKNALRAATPTKEGEAEAPKRRRGAVSSSSEPLSVLSLLSRRRLLLFVPSGEEVAALAESRLIEAAEAKGLAKKDG